MDRFEEIVEQAKESSKQSFLRFVKGIYDVGIDAFDHLWEVPVIPPYKVDSLIETSLSTKTEDEILEELDNFVEGELDDADGCFIYLAKMECDFTDEEIEEYRNKLNNGEINGKQDAVIIYNEMKLKRQFKQLEKENARDKKPHSKEELEKAFIEKITEVINHERCHLNANCLVCEGKEESDCGEILNGAEISSFEEDELIKNNSPLDMSDYSDRNEVLLDTLSHMMINYQEGDSVEDCLYKVIEKTNGESPYKDLEGYKLVMSIYVLFPEELTKWATFGAYDSIENLFLEDGKSYDVYKVRTNKLRDKIIEVLGSDNPIADNRLKGKITEYCSSLEDGVLTEKQVQMLEMLGIRDIKKADVKQVKEAAISEKALRSLNQGSQDMKYVNQSEQGQEETK